MPDDVELRYVVEAVRALTGGRGADYAFEATSVAALAFVPLLLIRDGGLALQVSGIETFGHIHGLVEATKRAFAIRDRLCIDPAFLEEKVAPWRGRELGEGMRRVRVHTDVFPLPNPGPASAEGPAELAEE